MGRMGLMIVTLTAGLGLWTGPSPAQTPTQTPPISKYCDQSIRASVETKLAACTAMITSDKFAGNDLANIYLMRARINFFNNNDRPPALADFDRALKLNPHYAAVYYYRSFVHMAQNEPDLAIADLNEAIKLNPDEAELYTQRGLAHAAKHDYDRAQADFDLAIKLDPEDPYPTFLRGSVRILAGGLNASNAELNRLLESLSREQK